MLLNLSQCVTRFSELEDELHDLTPVLVQLQNGKFVETKDIVFDERLNRIIITVEDAKDE